MAYDYAVEKRSVFTDEGQRMFLRVRDFSAKALKLAGAVRADKLLDASGGGDSWQMMAAVDRLVELGELVEATPKDSRPWQWRVFTAAR